MRIIDDLAPARIAAYRRFLRLRTDDEVNHAYLWNYQLSSALFPMLGCIEMHLRDAVHSALAEHYAPAGTPAPGDYAWYDQSLPSHHPLKNRLLASVEDAVMNNQRRRGFSTNDIVASLTFGFWTNVIRSLDAPQRPRIIPRIFPNHPVKNSKRWGDKQLRLALDNDLRLANDFRNRVAHHEPLFKFLYNEGYPRNLDEGLHNLRACVERCLVISEWVDPQAKATLLQTHWFKQFDLLATPENFHLWLARGVPSSLMSFTWPDPPDIHLARA